jgi:hypothetical protein
LRRLTLIAAAALALVAAACGSDGEEAPTPTYTVPGGVNTSLPRHLASVTPAQGSTVTWGQLLTGGGVCAAFDFRVGETMGEDPTVRVTLIVSEEDVTDSSEWVVTDDFPTSAGTICYEPPDPLPPGEQVVTVRYTDATDRQFVYNWTFTLESAES